VGTVLDSVPFKTTLATGLYRGGNALSALGDRLSSSSGGTVVPGEVPPSDLENNGANNKGQNPQLPPPSTSSNAITKGPAAWINSGISKLSDHIASDPSSGITAQNITDLAKTPAGKSLLMRASSLKPGSAMMKNLTLQAKRLLNP
jgi:hypothetical protein